MCSAQPISYKAHIAEAHNDNEKTQIVIKIYVYNIC
jgi:hypothetical protein